AGAPVRATGAVVPAVQDVFNRMQEHFDQCMVIIYADEKLTPWQWDSSWILKFNAPPAIETAGASVFRIVLDSKGPYHGYVSPNEINDAFFQAWNQGRYPEHLTITPMLVQNEVVGMLLGTTNRVRGAMVPLGLYQSVAIELAQTLNLKAAA
ncbi:MAG TPA: hypothetical protein VFV50_13250, partial [Bdellovibrionales bacterium]|nr:hypothetical protein [Bdellovibrionales bacterium]